MHISNVKVALTKEDILSIIEDFVKVDNLSIDELILKDQVTVKGSYKALVTLNFTASAEIIEAVGKRVRLNISSVKLYRLGILSFIKNLSLKVALKKLNKEGISFEENTVVLDLDKLLKDVPFVAFDLVSASIEEELVKVEAENINLSLNLLSDHKEAAEQESTQKNSEELCGDNSSSQEKEKIEEIEETEEQEIEVEKVTDYYSDVRETLENKLPEKVEAYSDYAFLLTDVIALLVRILKDNRVSLKVKIALGASIAYISSPFDILPDKLPFLGRIDDLGVAIFALSTVIEGVPKEIILSNWPGDDNILATLENVLPIAKRFTSGAKIEKIYSFMDDIITA